MYMYMYRTLYEKLWTIEMSLVLANLHCQVLFFFFLKLYFDIFSAMNILDADEKRLCSNGKYAARDIVQVK